MATKRYEDEEEDKTRKPPKNEDDGRDKDPDNDEDDYEDNNDEDEEETDKAVGDLEMLDADQFVDLITPVIAEAVQKAVEPLVVTINAQAEQITSLTKAVEANSAESISKAVKSVLVPIVKHIDDNFEEIEKSVVGTSESLEKAIGAKAEADDLAARTTPAPKQVVKEEVIEKSVTTDLSAGDEVDGKKAKELFDQAEAYQAKHQKSVPEFQKAVTAANHGKLTNEHLTALSKAIGE